MIAWLLSLPVIALLCLVQTCLAHLPLKKKDYPTYSVEVLSHDETSIITDTDGNHYDLSRLRPYVDLFSNRYFVSYTDNNKKSYMIDKRTDETIQVSVFRAVYDDHTVVIAEKNERGKIVYLEVRRPRGESDLFLVQSPWMVHSEEGLSQVDEETFSLMAFTENDIDEEELQAKFHYGEVNVPEEVMGNEDRFLRSVQQQKDHQVPLFLSLNYNHESQNATFSGSHCDSFRVVRVAIAFDSDFCRFYGGYEATRRRILTIVASASYHYERDLCVKLELTDIYTPDNCFGYSMFEDFAREIPCGKSNSFLDQFSKWMKKKRASLEIDDDSTVHIFSGFHPPQGTVGCAYVGSLCQNSYAYGIEYMTFSSNPHAQGTGKLTDLDQIHFMKIHGFTHLMHWNFSLNSFFLTPKH